MPKISAQVLAFDNQRFFEPCLEHLLPQIDHLVVLYSELPWAYNPTARKKFKNQLSKERVYAFSGHPKVSILEGIWENEEDQRNAGLDLAKESGMDFMLVVDPDEFYLKEDLQKNIVEMCQNPDFDYYRNPWHLYWKNDRNRILFKSVETNHVSNVNYSACFAMNLNRDARFENKRLPNTRNFKMLSGVCHHMSYVFSDEEMRRKIETWGHHSDAMDLNAWFEVKWLGWTPRTKNISIINPLAWYGTEQVDNQPQLSQVFGFENPNHSTVKPFFIRELLYDAKAYFKFYAKKIKGALAQKSIKSPKANSQQ